MSERVYADGILGETYKSAPAQRELPGADTAVRSDVMPDYTQSDVDLYRFYDDADTLLYVGISLHAAQRASQHRRDKPWWPTVARMEIERHPSRSDALAAEASAIRAEVPVYNVVHNQPSGSEPSNMFPPDALIEPYFAVVDAVGQYARALDLYDGDDCPARSNFVQHVGNIAAFQQDGSSCSHCRAGKSHVIEIPHSVVVDQVSVRCDFICRTCCYAWSVWRPQRPHELEAIKTGVWTQ